MSVFLELAVWCVEVAVKYYSSHLVYVRHNSPPPSSTNIMDDHTEGFCVITIATRVAPSICSSALIIVTLCKLDNCVILENSI